MQPEQHLPPSETNATHTALDDALNALQHEAPKANHRDSLKACVRIHFDSIESAHLKGHSWSRLATLFQECLGRPIAPETLRKYMAQIRAERDQTSLSTPKSPVKSTALPRKFQTNPADAFNYPGGDRK
jgi:hypothetical protein